MKKTLITMFAALCAVVAMAFMVTPTKAETKGLGPWGDIDGYYTWQINGKGWTVYSQNGYSWIYDDYGNRIYLDAYGNQLYGVSAAAAKTITQYSLTYNSTVNGVVVYQNPDGKLYTVDNNGKLTYWGGGATPAPTPTPAPSGKGYTFFYSYTTPSGYNIYTDGYGKTWWFAAGGMPQRWTGGYPDGSYWRTDVHDYTYWYSYTSADGYYIYVDDYKNQWWFGSDGTPHLVRTGGGSSGGQGGDSNPDTPPSSGIIDYNHSNTMQADGKSVTVHVGEYWQAPKTVSYTPAGTRLIGWDYAEGTNYVRWKPGAWIRNTGGDLYLYPVYGS